MKARTRKSLFTNTREKQVTTRKTVTDSYLQRLRLKRSTLNPEIVYDQYNFYVKSDKSIIGFKSKGHAGFGVRGTDVVCASVSILLINTVNSIEKLTSEECSYKINDRRATIDFQMDTVGDGSQLLLQSLKMGLEGIADGYPGNVTINIEEV